jgi:hypothetical protein
MPNCQECRTLVKRRIHIKNLLSKHTNVDKKNLSNKWKKLIKKEAYICKKCKDDFEYSVLIQAFNKIPKVRQWPETKDCLHCKKTIKYLKDLKLYQLIKGKEHIYLSMCINCIHQCKRLARTCPGALRMKNILEKRAIEVLPIPPIR